MNVTITERLSLSQPCESDVPPLFALFSDPRVWTHLPSARHTAVETTDAMVRSAMRNWESDGLGAWTVRSLADDVIIGWGGCRAVHGELWNLGYRLDASVHGRGLATELANAAIAAARATQPTFPVVAMMLKANPASERVAQKVGLTVRYEGPDPGAGHLPCRIYADAPLTDAHVEAYLADS